jgi:amino acid adenylation domain-containing protein
MNEQPITTTNSSLLDMSDAKRALLQKYLQGSLPATAVEPPIVARRVPGIPPPPSLGQEQLWLHAQMVEDATIYNEPVTVRRIGALDVEALKRSLDEIIRRHEAWRTNFVAQDGQLVQVINPFLHLELPLVDLSNLAEPEREGEALRLATQDARRPFDLREGALLRALLVRLSDADHRLFITLHQIIFDGVSLYSVFLPELETLYEAFANGQPTPLSDPSLQYADFAYWQRDRLQDQVASDELAYWKEQLAGAPTSVELPTDRPRPAIQTFNGKQVSFNLSRQLSENVKAMSRREGTTLFMTLLAAFQTLLYRYTEQDDLLIGTVTTSRKRSEFDALLGFFLNTLVLRADLKGNPTFRELLKRVRKVTVNGLAYSDVPIRRLVKELERDRDPSRNPLFQVMFVLEPPLPAPRPGWELSQVDVDAGIARVDLYLELDDRPEGLIGRIRYNSDLFDAPYITCLLAHFKTLLEGVVANAGLCIADYPLGTLIGIRNPADTVGPANLFTTFAKHEIEQSIADRFESQVSKYPSHVAVKSRTREWTYQALNCYADQVAQSVLSRQGDGEGRVALLFEHDAPMIAALLGALKAGKTYVPLDPSYPKERLAYILEDSQAGALITNDQNLALAQELAVDGITLINIDRLDSAAPVAAIDVQPERLAYILYTSGSTGNPKGVMQSHRNVLHFVRAYTNNLHLHENDRLTLLSSYCFDAAVMDIYGALLNGATLYPIDIKQEGLAGLTERLQSEQITIYHSTPTVYRYVIKSLAEKIEFPEVRLVVLGGEEVKRSDVDLYKKHFADKCLLVNGLGPTEATVSLQYFIDRETKIPSQGVPVGYPVADTEILLLNRAGKRAEIRGEIAIQCDHVALGYWRNEQATEAAFAPALAGVTGRVYRTGDMGRRLPDGAIVFEGRKDFQIKIRGFRVELGEIESAISQHRSVRENVVMLRKGASGESLLVAYLVLDSDDSSIVRELRESLKQKLPDYMLPASFVVLADLPLTASGKVNRRALPEPKDLSELSRVTVTLPRTLLEKKIAGIWSDVLGVKSVGVNDNFFELGGHSLLAVRLFSLIGKEFDTYLPLATLFQAPTVAQLAALLERAQERDWNPQWSSLVPIQPDGDRPPFFCVHAVGGNVLEYYDLARHLGADQPFYGLQSRGLDGKQSPHKRIAEMAAHYLKEIREFQPAGPYFIGGRSLGGMIAYEMACQLRASGEEVGLLALLDTYPAGYVKLLPNAGSLRTRLERFMRRFESHVANVSGGSLRQKFSYAIDKARYAPIRLKRQMWRMVYRSYQNVGRDLPRAFCDVQEFNWLAAREFVPQVYGGSVTLFWASSDLRASFDLVTGWRRLAAGGMEVQEIPGTHLNMVEEPHVQDLAVKLRKCLERAQLRKTTNSKAMVDTLVERERDDGAFLPERPRRTSREPALSRSASHQPIAHIDHVFNL